MQKYLILFGKKPESKDLRDPKTYVELYQEKFETKDNLKEFFKKYDEFKSKGFTLKKMLVEVSEDLDFDETLEVKITKSYLKPSPEGTLGSDFEL